MHTMANARMGALAPAAEPLAVLRSRYGHALQGRGRNMGTKPETTVQRILAIDDEKDMLDVLRLTLGTQYDVMTLSNPVDAYELIDLFEPDLVIVDVMMPRITGFQLLELLQKNARTRNLPVIIVSAKSSQHEIKHGYSLGAKVYLTKPFEPERLLRNIRAFFETNETPAQAKRHPIEAVQMHLQLKSCYKSGAARLTGPAIGEDGHELHPSIPRSHLRERLDR